MNWFFTIQLDLDVVSSSASMLNLCPGQTLSTETLFVYILQPYTIKPDSMDLEYEINK